MLTQNLNKIFEKEINALTIKIKSHENQDEKRLNLLSLIQRLVTTHQYVRAITYSDIFLTLFNPTPDLYLLLIESSYQLNDFILYEKYCIESIKKYPDSLNLQQVYSRYLELQGKPFSSLKILKNISDKNESILPLYFIKLIQYVPSIRTIAGIKNKTLLNDISSIELSRILYRNNEKESAYQLLLRILEHPQENFSDMLKWYLAQILINRHDNLKAESSNFSKSNDLIPRLLKEQIWNTKATLRHAHSILTKAIKINLRNALDPIDETNNRDNYKNLIESIRIRIENEIPTSLIRLGDGEGCFLPYAEEFSELQQNHQQLNTLVWWGKRSSKTELSLLQKLLLESISGSDIIGITDLYRLIREFQAVEHSGYTRHVLGITAVNNYFLNPNLIMNKTFTSSHIHEYLEDHNAYEYLLSGVKSVNVITGHQEAKSIIQKRFGIKSVRIIKILPEYRYQKQFGQQVEPHSFPTEFDKTCELIRSSPKGLYLVAAGYIGKYYCKLIKDQGGVALDIGSVIDSWLGYNTRNTQIRKINK